MKNKTRKTVMLLSIGAIALLGSCGGGDSSGRKSDKTSTSSRSDVGYYVTYKGEELDNGANLTLTIGDGTAMLVASDENGESVEFVFTSSDIEVLSVGQNTGLVKGLKAGTADVEVHPSTDANNSMTFHFTVQASSVATGAKSYASESYEEKAKILAALEKYAVNNYMTGITMFSNGSNICYNTRYVPTPASYITGYGWGTYREGVLNGNIQNPLDGNDPSYYQVGTTSLPAHVNAMNASGSDVSSVQGYISNAFYSTRLNEANDGYEWYSQTALDNRPLPIDDSGNVITDNVSSLTNTRWRIHVRTGSDFVYRTASTKTYGGVNMSRFDGQAVTIDDYVTPIKFMLTQFNQQYRGAELTTGVSGFAKQAADYYNKTSKNTTGDSSAIFDETAWKSCGMDEVIKTGHDDTGDYIEFNLLQPCTQFYAMYYLSSSLYSPLPAEFIKTWGASKLGKSPDGYTPLDTMLSTGPYYITEWSSKRITFKKNEQYFYKQDKFADGNVRDVYNLPGFQYNELEDSSQSKQYFLAGQIDSYSPNKDDLKSGGTFAESNGTSDTSSMTWRKYETKGDANFKLNVNASTSEQWNERFGTSGSVYAHTSSFVNNTSNNPFLTTRRFMSDVHFLNFLSFGMNRQQICESRGMKPTQEYFSDNYLIDPESGISYNSTDAHKAVLADRYNETYGYNFDAAASELRTAIEGSIAEAIEAGEIKKNSKQQYVINIDMEWMNTSDPTDYGDVFDSIKEVFNKVNSEDYGGMYVLNINQSKGSSDYNAVYDKMKHGEFDLGFGAISGGDLDPINFMEVLKSDNSSGFTLNWGPDTDTISDTDQGDVVYDGKTWSYDGLWNAANTAVLLNNSGDIASIENVSSSNPLSSGGNYKYQSKDASAKSVTYKLSFKDLVNAGAKADSISFTTTNGGGASDTYTLADLGATASNDYVATLVLSNEYNTMTEYDAEGKESTSNVVSVTGTVTYSFELNGSTKTLSSDISLLTYYGVAENK